MTPASMKDKGVMGHRADGPFKTENPLVPGVGLGRRVAPSP